MSAISRRTRIRLTAFAAAFVAAAHAVAGVLGLACTDVECGTDDDGLGSHGRPVPAGWAHATGGVWSPVQGCAPIPSGWFGTVAG